jgi:hypothetical protein
MKPNPEFEATRGSMASLLVTCRAHLVAFALSCALAAPVNAADAPPASRAPRRPGVAPLPPQALRALGDAADRALRIVDGVE